MVTSVDKQPLWLPSFCFYCQLEVKCSQPRALQQYCQVGNSQLSLPLLSQPNDPVTNICQAADKQLFTLVEWAKRIPHFSELALDDQVILLRAGTATHLLTHIFTSVFSLPFMHVIGTMESL